MRKRRKHGSGNLMIRMIDIVFILLFGFVAVSQISQAEATEPPKSEEASMDAPEGTHVLIIGVQNENHFSLEGGTKVFDDLHKLRSFVEQANAELVGREQALRVRIRAGWNAPIESCMRVAKLCRDLGIAKGIDVVKVNEQ